MRRITALCLRLLTDLARGGYGERPELDYLTPNCAASVHAALAAIGGDGWYVETDYGDAVAGTADLNGSDGAVRVELLVDEGAFGARLTGAGFGGCVVALTRPEDRARVLRRASERYRERTGRAGTPLVVEPVGGAGPLPLS